MGWKLININNTSEIIPITTVHFTIGRHATSNLLLNSATISKHHAIIRAGPNGELYIKDLSMNGTFLNSVQLEKCRELQLKHCDVICFGNSLLVPNQTYAMHTVNAFKIEEDDCIVDISKIKKSVCELPSIQLTNVPSTSNNNHMKETKYENEVHTESVIHLNPNRNVKEEKRDEVEEGNHNIEIIEKDDDVIDITSDDDVDKIYSQMYTNKTSLDVLDEQQMDFIRIKKELEYLDNCGEYYEEAGVVDVDYQMDSVGLLETLESQVSPGRKRQRVSVESSNAEMAITSNNCLANANVLNSPKAGGSKEGDEKPPVIPNHSTNDLGFDRLHSTQRGSNANVLNSPKAGCSKEGVEKPSVIPNQSASDLGFDSLHSPHRSKNLEEITQSIKAKHSDAKPMVINALPMKKGKKVAGVKRKGVDHEDIVTKRKEMIREICNKEKEERNAKKARTSDIRTQATNVKVSDNRGMYLALMEPTKAPNKRGSSTKRQQKEPTQLTRTEIDASIDFNASIDIPIGDEILPQILISEQKPKEIAPPAKKTRHSSPPQSASPPEVVRIDAHRNNEMHCHNMIPTTTTSITNYRSHKILYSNHLSFVQTILNWKISLFKDTGQSELVRKWPRISGGEVLTRLANTFTSLDHYKMTMRSLVLIEIFSECYNEFNTKLYTNASNEVQFLACIETIENDDKFTKLGCFLYLPAKNVHSGNLIKDFNFALFSVANRKEKKSSKSFMGIAMSPSSTRIRDTDLLDQRLANWVESPEFKHTFTIYAKPGLEVQEKSLVCMRTFCSLNRFLSKLNAVYSIGDELKSIILSPHCDQFVVPISRPLMLLQHSCLPPLNADQKVVVENAMHFCSPVVKTPFFLIQGPPGTGKTYVIISILLNILQMDPKAHILLLAQSNAAVDNLINFIARIRSRLPPSQEKCIKMIRTGNIEHANYVGMKYHIDGLVRNNLLQDLFRENPALEHDYHKITNDMQKLKKRKYRTLEENQRLKVLSAQWNNFAKDHFLLRFKEAEKQKRCSIISNANIICSTLGSSYSILSANVQMRYKCCIIDEASQASEVDTLMPLLFGVEKFIMVGDSKQLPPFNCLFPKEYAFNRSLFERFRLNLESEGRSSSFQTLRTQYRMVPEISTFPNRMFYNSTLKDDVSCKQRSDLQRLAPYLVFPVKLSHREEQYENKHEIKIILKLVSFINNQIQLTEPLTIGILTPYTDQRNKINSCIQRIPLNEKIQINCKTIDGSQGQESDIVILSFVRNATNDFINDSSRVNVALTRAKSALYIIASETLFGTSSLMRALRDDAMCRDAYVTDCSKEVNLFTSTRRVYPSR